MKHSILLLLAAPFLLRPSLAQLPPSSSPCHALIQQISQKLDARVSDELIDQALEMKWDDQLFDCRYKTPEQILASDWPKLVEIESRLRSNDIDSMDRTIKSMDGMHTALVNDEIRNYVSKKDYDDLLKLAQHVDEAWTHDYNELVNRYNGLLRAIKNAPPSYVSVPSRQQSIHCTATQTGVVSFVDCY